MCCLICFSSLLLREVLGWLREGRLLQNGWISGKFPNGLWQLPSPSSCFFVNISANIGHIWSKNIWHTLLGVVYHVKKVSTIFDENISHNLNLKKNCSISLKVIWKPIVQYLLWLPHVTGPTESLSITMTRVNLAQHYTTHATQGNSMKL